MFNNNTHLYFDSGLSMSESSMISIHSQRVPNQCYPDDDNVSFISLQEQKHNHKPTTTKFQELGNKDQSKMPIVYYYARQGNNQFGRKDNCSFLQIDQRNQPVICYQKTIRSINKLNGNQKPRSRYKNQAIFNKNQDSLLNFHPNSARQTDEYRFFENSYSSESHQNGLFNFNPNPIRQTGQNRFSGNSYNSGAHQSGLFNFNPNPMRYTGQNGFSDNSYNSGSDQSGLFNFNPSPIRYTGQNGFSENSYSSGSDQNRIFSYSPHSSGTDSAFYYPE